MRKGKLILLMSIIIVTVVSCIPSVHSLYHEEDLIMDESILGTWQDISEDITWEIYQLDENTYGVILTKDSIPAMLEVHLVKLSGHYFLDFYPEEFDSDEIISSKTVEFQELSYDCVNDFLSMHLFPVHTFARLDIIDDHLEIRRFDMDWLSGLFEKNKIRIAHEENDNSILLTASTDELQEFVSKYADEEEAYIEREYLVRKE